MVVLDDLISSFLLLMAKKRTKHAEGRALKKEEEAKHRFFHSPVQAHIHPFWDRSLEHLLDKLLKIDPSSLPYDIEKDRSLVDRWSEGLWFEELWVLNSVLEGVSRIRFNLSYDRTRVVRIFHWKKFFEVECGEYTIYAPLIWIDPKQVKMHLAGVGMDVWNYERFDFPDIDLGVGDVILNAITYWQSIVKTSGCTNPKGKSRFLKFLVILIQWMIFRPKGIIAARKGGPVVYEYSFDENEIKKFRDSFPKADLDPPGNWDSPFQVRKSVNWSLGIVHLSKILQEGRYFKKVVLITETRPGQKLQVTLRDFCETQWVPFVSRYFPNEVIDLDINEYSIYLIEDELLRRLCNYTRFGSSPIIPLSSIEKSHQQRRH